MPDLAPLWIAVAILDSANAAQPATAAPPAPEIGGELASPFEPFLIGARFYARLPGERTEPSTAILLAPAATDGGELGDRHPSISGATGFENRWFVDGFEVTEPGIGAFGPWSSGYGPLGWSLPLAWTSRVAVTGSVLDPGRGGAGGGAVDVLLPDGDERFTVSGEYALRPGVAEASRRQVPGPLRADASSAEDASLLASAPIVRDRLWLLGGIARTTDTTRHHVTPPWPLSALGEEVVRREHAPWLAKLVWRPSNGQQLDLLFLGDRGGSPFGLQDARTLMEGTSIEYSALRFGSELQGIRWRRPIGSRLDVESSVSRMATSFERRIGVDANRHVVTDVTGPTSSRSGGIGFYERSRRGERLDAAVAAGADLPLLGPHHLRAGVAGGRTTWRTHHDRSGEVVGGFRDEDGILHEYTSGLSYDSGLADDGSPYSRVLHATYSDPIVRVAAATVAAFVADRWQPAERLSVGAHLRVERTSLEGGGPGATGHTFPAVLAPGASAEWAMTHDRRLVTGLHVTRVPMPIPLELARAAMSGERAVGRVDYHSANFSPGNQIPEGTAPIDGDTRHVLTVARDGFPVRDGTVAPFYDEVAWGAVWRPAPALRLDVRVVHRELGAVVDDVLAYSPIETEYAGERVPANVVANPGTRLNATCPSPYDDTGCWVDPVRDYDSLELAGRASTGRVELSASWRWSRLYGNHEGVWRGDARRRRAFSAYDFPNGTPATTEAHPGALPLDRSHVVKVAIAVELPRGLDAGAIVRLRSGRARTRLIANDFDQDVPRDHWGDGGREPASATLDLRVSWSHSVRAFRFFAAADALNVFDAQPVEHSQPRADSATVAYGEPLAFVPPRALRLTIGACY